jgi:hypothetical protein
MPTHGRCAQSALQILPYVAKTPCRILLHPRPPAGLHFALKSASSDYIAEPSSRPPRDPWRRRSNKVSRARRAHYAPAHGAS